MNDKRLARSLQSVGMTCFVEHFEDFASDIPEEYVIEKLKQTTTYTANSCALRTRISRTIIMSGLAKEALALVVGSKSPRITNDIKEEARRLIKLTA